MPRLAALLATTLALTACAPVGTGASNVAAAAGERAPRQCFQARQVINFREGEAQQIRLRILGGDVFELGSAGCWDLGSATALSVTPAIGGSDRLCVSDTARIAVVNASLPQGPCLARVTRVLTPEQVEALPSRQRP